MYEKFAHTVNELKGYISDTFTEIDGDWNLCRTVCQSVLDRSEDCRKVEGGHFELLRDQILNVNYLICRYNSCK